MDLFWALLPPLLPPWLASLKWVFRFPGNYLISLKRERSAHTVFSSVCHRGRDIFLRRRCRVGIFWLSTSAIRCNSDTKPNGSAVRVQRGQEGASVLQRTCHYWAKVKRWCCWGGESGGFVSSKHRRENPLLSKTFSLIHHQSGWTQATIQGLTFSQTGWELRRKDGWKERKQLSCDLGFFFFNEELWGCKHSSIGVCSKSRDVELNMSWSASKLQRSSFLLMPNSVGEAQSGEGLSEYSYFLIYHTDLSHLEEVLLKRTSYGGVPFKRWVDSGGKQRIEAHIWMRIGSFFLFLNAFFSPKHRNVTLFFWF